MTQDLEKGGHKACRSRTPGDALLKAHELWLARERPADPPAVAAESLGMTPDAFEAIRDFHRRIIDRPKNEPLILCRGVSCRLHGAEDFHTALKGALDAVQALGATIDVHCLSQCEHGPNLKLGDTVLCTGKGCVVNDVRPWRPVAAGPQPVDSHGPPVAG
jgi:NADH:ubiquinone oxidoreductase subunit E